RAPYSGFSVFFFFSSRRRHTRFSRDWSSDVCSSDLQHGLAEVGLAAILAQSAVMQQPVPFAHVADGQAPALVMGNGIAGTETHPGQRGGANRIVTGLATGREQHDHQAAVL